MKTKKPLYILTGIIFILYLGFVLAFSRSAYLALGTAPLIFTLILFIIKRSYLGVILKIFKIIWSKHKNIIIPLAILIVASTAIFTPHIFSKTGITEQAEDYSVQGRMWYADMSLDMIKDNPDFGVGPGMYTFNIDSYATQDYIEWWQYQPVHNVLLLIGSELGVTSLLLFMSFLGWLITLTFISFKKKSGVEKILLSACTIVLFGLIIIMQFDHYLWTLQQGSLILWSILGMTATATTKLRNI